MKLRYILAIVFLFVVSRDLFGQTLWDWNYPKPQGNTLRGLILKTDALGVALGDAGTAMRRSGGVFLTAQYPTNLTLRAGSFYQDTMWIVGDSGHIFRSINNGTSWISQRYSAQHLSFYATQVRDKNTLWVAGDSGYILYSTNGGTSFTKQTNTSRARVFDIGFARQNVYACGDSGTLMRGASYGGAGYAKFSTGKHFAFHGLALDTSNVFAVGDSGYILRRSFADEVFIRDTSIASPTFGKTITFNDIALYDNYVIAVGSDGTIKRSVDTGWTWTTPASQTGEHLNQIKFASDFSSSGVAWIVGEGGTFLRSTNYGSTWVRLDSGIKQTIYAAGRSPSGVLYVTSTGGLVFRSSNDGMTWRRDSLSNIGARLMDVAFDTSGFGLLATYDSKVLRTLDSGATWAAQNVGTASTLILGVAVQGNIGLASGANGQLFRTSNRGTSWSSVTSNTNRTLYDVDLFGTNAIAVGDNGATVHSTNAGLTWASVTSGTTRFNRVRFAASPEYAVAVAQAGAIFRTSNHGQNWTSAASGVIEHLNDIQFHDDRNGIAVGDRGTIIKTTNTGAAWSQDESHTINDLKGAIVMSGTDAFVAGNRTTILFTSNSSLPVELLTMKAKRLSDGSVALDWKVAREENNSGFAIDRELQGTWSEISFIAGAGTTATARSYYHRDADAPVGQLSYRIRQIDLDGSEHLLGTVTVGASKVDASNALSVFPNPAHDAANITFVISTAAHVHISIMNALGAEAVPVADREFDEGVYTIKLDTKQFTSGVYQIVIERNGDRTTRNLIVD